MKFLDFLLQLSPNFTITNIVLVFLGMVIYFAGYFKTRNPKSPFSFSRWFKDNWYNIPIMTATLVAYFILFEGINAREAFLVGVIPNLATDWISKLIENRKSLKG